jgi:Zn-dependent oligopeptidase
MLHDYRATTAESVTKLTTEALERAAEQVAAAVADPGRTFAGTMLPLEEAATIVADAYGRGAFMARVHPDPAVRVAAVQAEERLTKWTNDLVFRRDLYSAIEAFAATEEAAGLAETRRRLLDHWRRDLRRAGHLIEPADRERLHGLRQRLIELQVTFAKNLDECESGLELTRDELDGLSDEYVEGLAAGSAPGTYRVTTAYPDYLPFMQDAVRRDLRERLQLEFWNRAAEENRPLLDEAVALRAEMAEILGHASWAEHAMEIKMAKHPKAVDEFYDSILHGLEEKARHELRELTPLLEADHPGAVFSSWDLSYYHTQQKRTHYGVDPNEVAAYFPLDRVFAGLFEITGEVFGLEYRQVPDAPAWHPDVTLYEIRDRASSQARAHFYADLFPREGKYSHAAAFPLVYGKQNEDGTYRTPVAAIVANFTKPTPNRPSLLKHREALTLFHEFGHVLHFCLTTVDLIRFSGYDTEWDFVEAPSQIMEHWMWQPEVLQRFARHHEHGEPISADLVRRLVAARDLNVGLNTLRQVFLGKLDLMLHDGRGDKDVDVVTRQAFEHTLLPYHEGTNFAASFGHLMGGYDAGYYGYLWSRVYGDDMFSVFQHEGVLSADVGERYRREVLSTGGSRDAIEHLRAFLGRDPTSDAFLRNLGLS